MELIVGNLYQVYYNKDWRIGTFTRIAPAHDYKYANINMNTLTIGKDKIGHEPERYVFLRVRGGADANYSSAFWVPVRGAQIRETTQETVVEVQSLQQRVKEADEMAQAARKALRDFTGW